jgi:hypothetical protein
MLLPGNVSQNIELNGTKNKESDKNINLPAPLFIFCG